MLWKENILIWKTFKNFDSDLAIILDFITNFMKIFLHGFY